MAFIYSNWSAKLFFKSESFAGLIQSVISTQYCIAKLNFYPIPGGLVSHDIFAYTEKTSKYFYNSTFSLYIFLRFGSAFTARYKTELIEEVLAQISSIIIHNKMVFLIFSATPCFEYDFTQLLRGKVYWSNRYRYKWHRLIRIFSLLMFHDYNCIFQVLFSVNIITGLDVQRLPCTMD